MPSLDDGVVTSWLDGRTGAGTCSGDASGHGETPSSNGAAADIGTAGGSNFSGGSTGFGRPRSPGDPTNRVGWSSCRNEACTSLVRAGSGMHCSAPSLSATRPPRRRFPIRSPWPRSSLGATAGLIAAKFAQRSGSIVGYVGLAVHRGGSGYGFPVHRQFLRSCGPLVRASTGLGSSDGSDVGVARLGPCGDWVHRAEADISMDSVMLLGCCANACRTLAGG